MCYDYTTALAVAGHPLVHKKVYKKVYKRCHLVICRGVVYMPWHTNSRMKVRQGVGRISLSSPLLVSVSIFKGGRDGSSRILRLLAATPSQNV